MGIADRFDNIRQLLPGSRAAVDEERLLQLFWNRAELKKELNRLQLEHHMLLEEIKKQDSAVVRAEERLAELQEYLGDPEVAVHALAYFQLRALWRGCARKLERFAEQLFKQQHERERQRQVIEFDQARRRQLADLDTRLVLARSEADTLEAQLKLMESELTALQGFWNYFHRKHLAEEIEDVRTKWDVAATRVTDLSDDKADIEERQPPPLEDLSIDGKRIVNTASIAYAQQLVMQLSSGGLAMLAKETTAKPVYDMRYGTRENCVRLMALLRDAMSVLQRDTEDLAGLKERTDALRSGAAYRSDADTIPLTDSIGTIAAPTTPVSGLESINKTGGIHVLVDDYWNVYEALLK
jgi:hypothetical protein